MRTVTFKVGIADFEGGIEIGIFGKVNGAEVPLTGRGVKGNVSGVSKHYDISLSAPKHEGTNGYVCYVNAAQCAGSCEVTCVADDGLSVFMQIVKDVV